MCGLRTADSDLGAALGQLIGRPLSEDDWRLGSLGVTAGGLGTRCAAEHAPAAYVASFSTCRELCVQLWPAFDPFNLDEGCRLAAAEEALRGAIPSGANIYAVSDSPSQKSLSGMIEARSVSGIFGDPFPGTAVCTSRLAGFRVLGLGSPLSHRASIPKFLPSLFRLALQRRLRMPLWDRDTACSMCGEVLDRWGDHALACCCGGDRVLRHNAIRDVVCSAVAEFTTVSPELEKPGLLLLPRPPILGVPTPMSTPPLFLPHPLPLVAALPIFGFSGASLASLRPGTSRFLRCFAPLTSLLHPPLLPMSSTKLKPGNAPSRTRPLLWPSAEPPSARLSWRLALAGGLRPSGAS